MADSAGVYRPGGKRRGDHALYHGKSRRLLEALTLRRSAASGRWRSGSPPQDDVESLIPGVTNLLVLLRPDAGGCGRGRTTLACVSRRGNHPQANALIFRCIMAGELACDLEAVCRHTGLPASDVIRRHYQGNYTVVALGSAGLWLLTRVDPALATPRKKSTVTEYAQRHGHYRVGRRPVCRCSPGPMAERHRLCRDRGLRPTGIASGVDGSGRYHTLLPERIEL
ncbi:hypothetical protein CWS02_07840 [Enterobacter sp. EA-1]|nr:hypothetical protein CWS02_07840 [Enterobacter sp. EA-1]